MHDELRWNKLFGAILATGLMMMLLVVGASALFAPAKFPAKPGDAIAVQAASADAGAEPADTPPDWGTVLSTADVAAGQTVSAKCQSCHNLANGGPNETGPNLWGVIGRPPGTHAGFQYSSAMTDFGKKQPLWDYNHIYMFLAGPQSYISGTKMSFVGLKKREDRINLIAWLRSQSSSPLAIPPADPKAAAAATAPAGAAASAPAPNPGSNIPASDGAARAPAAVAGGSPSSGSGGEAPTTGAAAAPTQTTSNPGGPAPGGDRLPKAGKP